MFTSLIIKSAPKFFTASYVFFTVGFTTAKINSVFETSMQIVWSDEIVLPR